jgi:DNA-binding NarL/FixJ family response regulator
VAATVAIIVVDLMFQSRIRMAAEALGLDARIADGAADANVAIAAHPDIAVVDLHAAGIDAPSVIRSAKAAGATVLAFGRHTEPSILRSARDAGADAVVARSQLVEELPQLLRSLLPGDAAPEVR